MTTKKMGSAVASGGGHIEDRQEVYLRDHVLTAAVRSAAQGDRRAFDALIERFQGEIFRMVYYRLVSRMDAEDVVQEIFMKAYRGVRTLKDPEAFRSWLYRIALNAVNDHFRRKRLRSIFTLFSREGDEDRVPCPDQGRDPLEDKEFWSLLGSFLSKLSKAEQEVFRLRFLDGLGIREIAEVLGKNQSTVKTHLYRAVEKFRREKGLEGLLQEKSG